jgi:hypothetical protein
MCGSVLHKLLESSLNWNAGCSVYHLKCMPKAVTYSDTNLYQKQVQLHVKFLPSFPLTIKSRSPALLDCCQSQLCKAVKSCACARTVCSWTKYMSFLEHCLTLKSHADICKAFSVCILTRKYQITQEFTDQKQHFRIVEVFACGKCSWRNKSAEIMVLPISSSASAVTMGYSCKNLLLSLVLSFCAIRASCCWQISGGGPPWHVPPPPSPHQSFCSLDFKKITILKWRRMCDSLIGM